MTRSSAIEKVEEQPDERRPLCGHGKSSSRNQQPRRSHPRVSNCDIYCSDAFRRHYNLGGLYMQQGDTRRAVAAFRKAIELDENDPEPYIRLGWIYASQKKF